MMERNSELEGNPCGQQSVGYTENCEGPVVAHAWSLTPAKGSEKPQLSFHLSHEMPQQERTERGHGSYCHASEKTGGSQSGVTAEMTRRGGGFQESGADQEYRVGEACV